MLLYEKPMQTFWVVIFPMFQGSLQEYLNFLQKNASKNWLYALIKNKLDLKKKKNLEMGNPKFISCNHANRNAFSLLQPSRR
jgi:uncharacterized membrane protein YheB (UPF0754 family)